MNKIINKLLVGYYTLERVKDIYNNENEENNSTFHSIRILATVLTANFLYLCLLVFSSKHSLILLSFSIVFGFIISFLINDKNIVQEYNLISNFFKFFYALLALIHIIGTALLFIFL
jgi:hypothetical protein